MVLVCIPLCMTCWFEYTTPNYVFQLNMTTIFCWSMCLHLVGAVALLLTVYYLPLPSLCYILTGFGAVNIIQKAISQKNTQTA